MAAHRRLESPARPVPADVGRARLGPLTLPCRLGTAVSFDYTGFNGRALSDDVMDVMLSLRANSSPGDGAASRPGPHPRRFPVFRFQADSLREELSR
jgi:hypothetical protein